MALPDVGTFVKHDQQRFVVGSLANQIRVLLQRMRLRGYHPWKILLSRGLRDALRLENSPGYVKHDEGDTFGSLPIVIDNSVREPLILVKPEPRKAALDMGQSTSEEYVWKRRKQLSS